MEKDIVSAAASGDRLETLIALRDLIAERLKNTGARETASLSLRLIQCTAEIEQLEKEQQAEKNRERTIEDMRESLKVVRKSQIV